MKRKDNSRRYDLLNKLHFGDGLSADEQTELDLLQAQMSEESNKLMQPQLDYVRKIAKGLEKRVEESAGMDAKEGE